MKNNKFSEAYKKYKSGGKMASQLFMQNGGTMPQTPSYQTGGKMDASNVNFLDMATTFAPGGKMPMYADGGTMAQTDNAEQELTMKQNDYYDKMTSGQLLSFEKALKNNKSKVTDQFNMMGEPNQYMSEEESYKFGKKKKVMRKKK